MFRELRKEVDRFSGVLKTIANDRHACDCPGASDGINCQCPVGVALATLKGDE